MHICRGIYIYIYIYVCVYIYIYIHMRKTLGFHSLGLSILIHRSGHFFIISTLLERRTPVEIGGRGSDGGLGGNCWAGGF